MKSPIHYHKPMGLNIDLSKLVEVSDVYTTRNPHGAGWQVGFHYRYSEGETIKWFRSAKRDESSFDMRFRNRIHEQNGEPLEVLPDDAELIRLGYEMRWERSGDGSYKEDVLFKNELGVPWCEINMQKDVDQLIEAWVKWKDIEPEVYAIIRKHLS